VLEFQNLYGIFWHCATEKVSKVGQCPVNLCHEKKLGDLSLAVYN